MAQGGGMRRAAAALAVAAALLGALATNATAHWAPQELSDPTALSGTTLGSSVLLDDGTAIATLSERRDDGSYRAALATFPRTGATSIEHLDAYGALLATGGNGATVAAYTVPGSPEIGWRVRPAGGSFGPEHRFATNWNINLTGVLMNAAGDIAFVWTDYDGIFTAIRRAGEAEAGAPITIASAPWSPFQAQLSDTGDLLVAWQQGDSQQTALYATSVSPSGQVGAVQHVASFDGDAYLQRLAMDSAGHALLTWWEGDAYTQTPRLWTRSPGGDFAPAEFPGGVPPARSYGIGITGSGRVTVASWISGTLRVYSGMFGQPFERVAAFAHTPTFNDYDSVAVATSRGGQTVLAWNPGTDHPLMAQLSPDGNVGGVEDLDPACGPGGRWTLNVNDAGDMFQVATVSPSDPTPVPLRGDTGPGQQTCTDSRLYDDAALNPPPRGGPGGGTWTQEAPPPAPEDILRGLRLEQPALSGSGADYSVRIQGECGEYCLPAGSIGVVKPNGRTVFRMRFSGLPTGADGHLDWTQPFTLPPNVLAKVAGHPLHVVLRLKLWDQWSRRVARKYALYSVPHMRRSGHSKLLR